MDLIKKYIVQSISAASNNLRLSTEKIEVVALLREAILRSGNLEEDIKGMKKITELSTLAIRLNEIYNYLTMGQIDFLKLSEKFKEHSQYLIRDLNHMLDTATPSKFKEAVNKLYHTANTNETTTTGNNGNSINVDLSKRKPDEETFIKPEDEILKEKLIFEDEKESDEFFLQNYEAEILKQIKPVDAMLKQLSRDEFNPEELLNFANIMNSNGEISAKIGFEIIANMHKIISKALLLIRTRELMPGRDIIESIRACLIVIVAVVKGKEVDITGYLNRAEELGKKIQPLKVKEIF